MKLLDMETFVAVAKTGSFAKAAERMAITGSAASRRVARLEETLQARLFHRTTRTLTLTEAGVTFFKHAQSSLTAAQDAVDAVKTHQSSPEGHLRIHAPLTYGNLFVTPLIPTFLERYPNLKISLFLDDNIPDLLSAELDLALTSRKISAGTYIARKVSTLTSVLCATPGYLKMHPPIQHPRDLSGHNCLFYEHSENAPIWYFSQGQETIEIPVSGTFQSDNSEAIYKAILAGLGVARLPRYLVNADIQAGQLVALLPAFEMPAKSMYMVYPDREHKPAKLKAFLDYFAPHLAKI
jgi:DNA-binding transcriptional LysR family regulator